MAGVCTSSFEDFLLNLLVHLMIRLFLVFTFLSSLHIININPPLEEKLIKIFPPFCILCLLLIVSYAAEKIFTLLLSN